MTTTPARPAWPPASGAADLVGVAIAGRDEATAAAGVVPATGSLVELRGVSKWYGNVVAVNDITMTLGAGVTGLLGPNGAGKTTVLHMMAGFLPPSRGEVLVAGQPAWRNPPVYSGLGIVVEREAVHGFLSGWEFVLASAKLHRLPNPQAAARKAVELVDMVDAMNRRMDTYSKGMRQRMRVAAALVHDPAVLLLDEPFNGMDPRQRMHMMELLHTMGDSGRTVLFSSHILEEVEQVSGTVQVIVAGRLAASGDFRTIRRLMTHRPHVFTIRSSDDRRLAVALVGLESVAGVELDAKSGLTVKASDYGTFTRTLPKVALAEKIRVQRLVPADESLESVFSYLVGGS
jgi:ABC-2 type transport system ATP-binding protein